MSKSIIIDEAGLPKALTVDALRTSKQGGGTEDWVPADGKNLVELDIGGSGTYRASDYNAYGISVARVTPKYGGGATSTAALQPVFANLHTPAIREGGNPKYMSTRLLKTNLQGGGTCLWVPEDEVNLESKYVDHSGTYRAGVDNCYGYSQITVTNVDVEIKQDEDGDDVAETTDGDEVTEEKLPSEIRIERKPDFVGPYGNGAYISFTGLLVKAYTKSGRLWTNENHPNGIIPISELTFPVTVTDISQVEYKTASVDDPSILNYPENNPIILCDPAGVSDWPTQSPEIGYKVNVVASGALYGLCISADEQTSYILTLYSRYSFSWGRAYGNLKKINVPEATNSATKMTFDGVEGEVYFASFYASMFGSSHERPPFPMNDFTYPNYSANDCARQIFGGTITGSGQPVPVQFARPYDGLVLEDEFRVDVVELTQGGQGDD